MTPARPERARLLLVGGGHAHLAVLKELGMRPPDGVRITLIAKELFAPYSGMLPGLIAGDYSFDQCHVDLRRLSDFAGAEIIHGEVDGIDLAARRVSVRGQDPLDYDLVSFDIGITPDIGGIAGAGEHALAVKPISGFYPAWTELLERCMRPDGPRRLAVIGGGAAGYEIVLAARQRILGETASRGLPAEAFSFTLAAGGELLASLNDPAGRLAEQELRAAGVELVENDLVVEVTPTELVFRSGRRLACDAAILCTPGKPASWLAGTGLPLDDRGFLAIRPTLQSTGDDAVFAVGDCATMIGAERPKAGVFAVRQGPYLAQNLRHRLENRPLLEYRPQRRFLMLLSNGRKSAIAARGPFALRGRLLWRWKDWIDRRFMARFQQLPEG